MKAARRPLVLILHGPSGVGKESVIGGLQKATGIHRATSTTDRPPRQGERDGIDYHFVTKDEFLRRVKAGRFAEYARVYDDWKGLERSEIEGPLARGEDVIIRTDVQGARTWRSLLDGAVSVLIVATDPGRPAAEHKRITESRIRRRQPEISATELDRRLREVDEELADIPNNDYVVVNHHDGLDSAVGDILAIIDAERRNLARPVPWLRAAAAT
jgi:guanylate kinase